MRSTKRTLAQWKNTMKYKCLSIAGFDGSGGAGIQADLKTFSALGCYGMTVLTALPVQNTCGVKGCYDIPLNCIKEQLETIFEDITPDSIKIGMLFSTEIIEMVAGFLEQHAKGIPIVLDPVMVAKSGSPLLLPEAVGALKERLIPLATLITPNLPEAHALAGNTQDPEALAAKLLDLGPEAVLLKGGHAEGSESNDFLLEQTGQTAWIKAERVDSKNTHGTGCTLSAAIGAYLARRYALREACALAKEYVFKALKAAQHNSVGKGHGPVHHFHALWPNEES